MSASAAGVSSACFQQEEWSGVGFGPVVFRVHNANLSPYLRSFPRQRIFQGSGKSNWTCIRLPICFFPGRQKKQLDMYQTSNLLFPGPAKSKMVQTSNLLFPGPGKSKRLRLPICFFPGREKAKWFRLPICFFPGREKAKWFRLPICFFPGREKAKWFRLPICFFPAGSVAFSRAGKKQIGSLAVLHFPGPGKSKLEV